MTSNEWVQRTWLWLLLLTVGCAGTPPVRYTSPQFYSKIPSRVAVLPFDNESVDLVGPEMLRTLLVSRLRLHGYAPVANDRVDETLRGIGITDGGQLRAVTPQQTGAAVGAEGLFYGVVEEFAFLNFGFVLKRVVRLHLKLVLASTGETLWEDTGQGLTQRITLKEKEARRMFLEGLAERQAGNIFRSPLMPEAQEAVHRLLMRLPKR